MTLLLAAPNYRALAQHMRFEICSRIAHRLTIAAQDFAQLNDLDYPPGFYDAAALNDRTACLACYAQDWPGLPGAAQVLHLAHLLEVLDK